MAWKTITVDQSGGQFSSLALDAGGNPRISYYNNTAKDLGYARYQANTWSAGSVDSTGSVGQYTSLAIDNEGESHISYYATDTTDLRYAYMVGSTWFTETVSSDGNSGMYSTLVLDSDGKPNIVYKFTTGTAGFLWPERAVRYAYLGELGWEFTDLIHWSKYQSFGIEGLVMAMDANRYIHAGFDTRLVETAPGEQTSGAYLYWDRLANATLWEINDGERAISYLSIAADSQNRIHLSYYIASDYSAPAGLWYSLYTHDGGVSEASMQVVAGSSQGTYSSIAVDNAGRPHISYYDSASDDLKYAYQNEAGGWYIYTVDSSGNVGQYTDLVLDSSDRPYISYYDVTNNALKFAWVTTLPGEPTPNHIVFLPDVVR
jgi:hypothetical protein